MKPLKPILTDEQFLQRLRELKGKKSALAKEMNVSHTAVGKRLKSIEQKGSCESKKVALMVKNDLAGAAKEGLTKDINQTVQQMRSLQKLENLLGHIENNLEKVAAPLKDSQRPNTAYIKILVSLVREGRGLITDSFNIKKELFNMKAMATFMEGVLRIMEQYDPDVRTKLYVELSRLGVGEQTHGINEESVPGTQGN